MKLLIATVVNIQEEPDNRYHAAVTLVLPDNIEHVELMLEGISAEADASALSDTDPGTHSIGRGHHQYFMPGQMRCPFVGRNKFWLRSKWQG